MARPVKNGLDYFPLEVRFFDDNKIKRIKARFGTDGIAVYLYLLCRIYAEGYYMVIDEDTALDIAADLNITENLVKQVLNYLVARSLITILDSSVKVQSCNDPSGNLAVRSLEDTLGSPVTAREEQGGTGYLDVSHSTETSVFPVKVLTAASIQRRFQAAKRDAKREIEVEQGLWLLKPEETEPFIKVRQKSEKSENQGGFSPKNPLKESKVKEMERLAPARVINAFETLFGRQLSGADSKVIQKMSEQYDNDLLIEAMKITIDNGADNTVYLSKVLDSMERKGIKTVDQLTASKMAKSAKRKTSLTDFGDGNRYADMEKKYGGD